MKSLHIFALGCILWHSSSAYYTAEQIEQIEQRYESPMESEDQDYFAEQPQQQQQHQQSTIETLNQVFSQHEPSQTTNYGQSGNGIPASLLSGSSYGSSSSNNYNSQSSDLGGLKSMEGKSSEYSKVTHIPSGSVFSMPAKGHGPMEFESPYAKEPYSIVFRTHSMPVKIKQQHQTLPAPEVEFVRSQEEAHRIKHEVIRPVVQEVHEIIQPYRRVVQEIRPVKETIHTVVSKNSNDMGRGGGGGASPTAKGGAGPAAGHSSGRAGYSQSNGGLNIGYSEHRPSYASPKTHFRPQATQAISHLHAQQFSMPQFVALTRAPTHSRY